MLMIRPEVLHYAEFKDRGNMMRSRNVTYSDVCLRRSELATVIELLRAQPSR